MQGQEPRELLGSIRGAITNFVKAESGTPCDSIAFVVVRLLFIMMTFQNRLSGIIVLLMRLLQAPSEPVQDFFPKLSSPNNNFDF